MIYLASPYSHPMPRIRLARFECVCRAAGVMLNRGHNVLSPIAHTHPIAIIMKLPTGFDFWAELDKAYIDRCDEVWVLMISGWENSIGVRFEIDYATSQGKRVLFVDPSYLGIDDIETKWVNAPNRQICRFEYVSLAESVAVKFSR